MLESNALDGEMQARMQVDHTTKTTLPFLSNPDPQGPLPKLHVTRGEGLTLLHNLDSFRRGLTS